MKLKKEFQEVNPRRLQKRTIVCPWCGGVVVRKAHAPFCRLHCAGQWALAATNLGVQLAPNRAGFPEPRLPDQQPLGGAL